MDPAMSCPSAPRDRNGFQVAIFCALALEAESVLSVFDVCWEDQDKQYGKAAGDQNSYNTGVIGKYNVVLVHMPSMGGNNAALAAAGLRSSFRGIRLALVVGICGVAPVHPITGQEIVLGDVVMSTAVVQYDFGRQYPTEFQRKNTVEDSLGRASPEIRSFMNMLNTRPNRERFNDRLGQLVRSEEFRTKTSVAYPGMAHDHLYAASYLHQHQSGVTCDKCLINVGTCSRPCDELGCKENKLVTRHRYQPDTGQPAEGATHVPLVHLGRYGSANTVMKSGLDRDRLSISDGLTAFEMEGAGVWEQYPTILIKAACDYADSHKNKRWQRYAAAMAAGALKVLLRDWVISDPPPDGDNSASPVWHVPFDRMPAFVGRADELRDVEQMMLEPRGPRIVALLGLGGVGKSRLALELAFQLKPRSPPPWILWVQASEQSTFENDMLAIGIKLGIAGVEDKKADVKTLVKQQLSTSGHQWVLILDNADDTTLWGRRSRPGSGPISLVEYLPGTMHGFILITTRSGQVANFLAGKDIVELPAMAPDKAAEMFLGRLQKTDLAADRDSLSKLLEQLAYLPLAVVQATSFMNETQRPVKTYLDLMTKPETSVLKLLSRDFGDRSRYHDAINPVATTWLISFDHIRTYHPLAAALLSRMACFHEKGIPRSLLLDVGSELDEIDFIDAIAILTGYSFTTRQTATNALHTVTEEMYDMHRLVHLAARNWLKLEGTLSEYIRMSTQQLTQLFPSQDYTHKHIWAMYLPHARRLCKEVDGENLPERYELLEKTGLCLEVNGQYQEAANALTMVVNWRENLGSRDRRLFDAYTGLGKALTKTGEFSRAKEYLQQALDWQKERLGTDDPTTLVSMENLADVLHRQGKYDEAEQMYHQTMEPRERVLGKEHPSTLNTMNDLAALLMSQGKYGEAEQMYHQVIEVMDRVLGKEHPDTLTSVSNLALVLGNQGRYSEAEQIYRQMTEVRERVLGKEHPITLTGIHNLASALSDRGKYSEAEQIYRQVLEARERVLGKEHPDTIIIVNNFALMMKRQGKYSEAEQMYCQVIEVMDRVLGKEHPITLTSMHNLASALGNQGKHSEAEQIYRYTIEVRERVLGKEHPSTLASKINFASVLGDRGDYSEAEQIHRQVMEMIERVVGKEHPITLTNMSNLALVLGNQGKLIEAERTYRQVMEVRERVLGEEDPQTLFSVHNLACTLSKQGKHDEARRLQLKVVDSALKVFGPQHPRTKLYSDMLTTFAERRGRDTLESEVTLTRTLQDTSGPSTMP